MSYSPVLSSGFTNAKNRSTFISPQSGMCSLCTEDCAGTCEIAQAAVLGKMSVYPATTGSNQIASEKDYPLDFSCFNINGRVFGAVGVPADYENAEIFNVDLTTSYGHDNEVKLDLPFILPALIKLNWQDYFGGAAMAGVTCIVGEDARQKDPELLIENGKVTSFPMLTRIHDSFYRYYRGSGQMVLQCNSDDHLMGVPEIALQKYGFKALEFKFGQAAKGTQPVNKLKGYEDAVKKKYSGMLVHPDPFDKNILKLRKNGCCPNFYSYGRLPQWTEERISKRISELREMGMKNVYFKMAGYDIADIERVIDMAIDNGVDMVTFDGAGGGSGYSPSKMMNEWCLPTVTLENNVTAICKTRRAQGKKLPAMVITGGFSSEDQAYKALALGNGEFKAIGFCRAAMAAAMTGKRIGYNIKNGDIPAFYKKFGSNIEEIFGDLPDLRAIYGLEANQFSTGAIGVFSYLNKLGNGLRHFSALNRKFNIAFADRSDLIPLTAEARLIL
nr:glutamate synthase-related protein [uncultured Desulfobacter sp.]